jgi:ABC-type transporter MlaC component
MTPNEPRFAVNHHAIALTRPERSNALGLFFALILTATMALLNLRPIAHGSTTTGDPVSLVKGTVGQVLAVLSDKQMSLQLRQRKLLEIVAGRFDFTDMARSSLGYNWKTLSPTQQEQFVPLFTAFMEDAYLAKIDSYSGQKVQFLGQTSTEADAAKVKTVVQRRRIRAISRFESTTWLNRPATIGRFTTSPSTTSASPPTIVTSSIA